MPVEAQTVEYSYIGDGVTVTFPFPSKFLSASDIAVGLDGQEQLAGFSVAGAGVESGGSVTFSAAPVVGVRVLLLRRPPASQLIDFVNGQTVFEGILDTALDKLTMIVQYLLRGLSRSVRLSELDPSTSAALTLPSSAARMNKLLGFDAAGNVIVIAHNPTGSGTVLTDGIVDAGAAARAALKAEATTANISTRALAETINFDESVTRIVTRGYATAGDRGGASYARLGGAPGAVKRYHFQSADGAWWQMEDREFYVEALGAVADYVPTGDLTPGTGTACDAAVIDALEFANTRPGCVIKFRAGQSYAVTGANEFFIPSSTTVTADHPERRAAIYRTTVPQYKGVFAARDPAGLAPVRDILVYGIDGFSCDIGVLNVPATAGQSIIPYVLNSYENRYDIYVSVNGVPKSASTPDLLVGKSLNQIYLVRGSGASQNALSFTATAGQTVFSYPNAFTNVNQIIATANDERVTVASYTGTTVTLAAGVPVDQTVWIGALDTTAAAGHVIRAARSSASARNAFAYSEGVSNLSLNKNIVFANCSASGVGFYVGFEHLWGRENECKDCYTAGVFDRGFYLYGRAINCKWRNLTAFGYPPTGVFTSQKVTYYAFDNNPWNDVNIQEHTLWENLHDEFCGRGFAAANWQLGLRVRGHNSLYARFYGFLLQDSAGNGQPDGTIYENFYIRQPGQDAVYIMSSYNKIANGRISGGAALGMNFIEGSAGAAAEGNGIVNVQIDNCAGGGVRLRKQFRATLVAVDVAVCPVGIDLDAAELTHVGATLQACVTVGVRTINGASRNRADIIAYGCGQGVNIGGGSFYNYVQGHVYANTTNFVDGGSSTTNATGNL